MILITRAARGFSLLELTIASAILSVGSLAVFTLFLHWRLAPELQDARYEALTQAMMERPEPMYIRQFSPLPCEQLNDQASWPDN